MGKVFHYSATGRAGYLLKQQVSHSGHLGVQLSAEHQQVAQAPGHCFSSPAVECLQDKVRGERPQKPGEREATAQRTLIRKVYTTLYGRTFYFQECL